MGINETANTFHISRKTVRKYVRLLISSGKTTDQLLSLPEEHLREMFGCKEFRNREPSQRQIELHDDRNTGEHIGVKFIDGDVTMNGSKIDRTFTYRRLNNLFELNRKQGQNQPSATTAQPKVTVQYAPQKSSSLIEDVAEATIGAVGDLFQVGPGYDPQEEEFIRNMRKKKKKQIKPRF